MYMYNIFTLRVAKINWLQNATFGLYIYVHVLYMNTLGYIHVHVHIHVAQETNGDFCYFYRVLLRLWRGVADGPGHWSLYDAPLWHHSVHARTGLLQRSALVCLWSRPHWRQLRTQCAKILTCLSFSFAFHRSFTVRFISKAPVYVNCKIHFIGQHCSCFSFN